MADDKRRKSLNRIVTFVAGVPVLGAAFVLITGLLATAPVRAQTCPAPCVTSYPYTENFEAGFGNFSNVGGDNIDWTRLSGATPSSGTGPSSDPAKFSTQRRLL